MSDLLTGDVEHDAPILALAVCRCADAYVDCLAEFADTAAGNLSDCCQEHLQHLQVCLDRWRGAQLVADMRGRSAR